MTKETGHEVVVYEDGASPPPVPATVAAPAVMGTASLTGALALLPQYLELAQAIFRTEMVPGAIRGRADAVLAVMLAGYEIGIPPMQALSSIDIIDGKPAISPELMRALIMAQGHFFVLQASNTAATVQCRRKDWPSSIPTATFTWSLEDAGRVKDKNNKSLLDKKNWQNYPRAMLSARVTAEAGRANFADVLKGLSYTPDEVEDWEPQPAGLSTGAPPSVGPVTPMSSETLADLTLRLRAITGPEKDDLTTEWKAASLPPVAKLSAEQAEQVGEMLLRYEGEADPPVPDAAPSVTTDDAPAESPQPEGSGIKAVEDMGWGDVEVKAVVRYALAKPSFDGPVADLTEKELLAVTQTIDKIMDGGLLLVADGDGFKVTEASETGTAKEGYGHSEEPFS